MIEPGFFKSNLHHSFEYAKPAIQDYDQLRKNALSVLTGSIEKAITPEPVARTVLMIVKSKNPGFGYRVGQNSLIAPFVQFLFFRLFELAISIKFRMRPRHLAADKTNAAIPFEVKRDFDRKSIDG